MADGIDDRPDMGDLFDQLEELEETVDTPEEQEQVRETMRVAMKAAQAGGTFGRVIKGFGRDDLAEVLLGSILFGIPMAVEGGTQEVAEFIVGRPVYFAGTGLFAIVMTIGILYVAEIQDVRIANPIFGLIPRRLAGVLGVAFLAALVMLTAWGRVSWETPWLALANVVVAFVPMSIGGALGDLLPGS